MVCFYCGVKSKRIGSISEVWTLSAGDLLEAPSMELLTPSNFFSELPNNTRIIQISPVSAVAMMSLCWKHQTPSAGNNGWVWEPEARRVKCSADNVSAAATSDTMIYCFHTVIIESLSDQSERISKVLTLKILKNSSKLFDHDVSYRKSTCRFQY